MLAWPGAVSFASPPGPGSAGSGAVGTAPVPAAATGSPEASPLAADTRVHIVKALSGPSCTGYSSQSVPPSTIRVLVHGKTPADDRVVTVDFRSYVKNVLPDEWIASWDPAALQAGAVAVKSYAWFWVTHMGGYLDTDSPSTCFDVTDDPSFQVYRAGSATARTDAAVDATWNIVAREQDQVLQASYICTLPYDYDKPPNCAHQGAAERCGDGANDIQLSQYGSQACAEAGKGYAGVLRTYYGVSLQLFSTSTPQQLRTPDDFTLSGTSQPAVWNPGTGTWQLGGPSGTEYQWGTAGDIPAVSNHGDGRALIGVWRPANGAWYVKDFLRGTPAKKTLWGARGDIPVAAHYHGVSQPTVLATFRPSNGRWYQLGERSVGYGTSGDIPVPGNYHGSMNTDYAAEIAVWRPSGGDWHFRGFRAIHWGTKGDIPVPADYDGDGRTDVAVFRPASGTWYVRGAQKVRWGARGDIPVTGDFNGDGKSDIAVYRPSNHTWYIRGQKTFRFGTAGARPVGRAPDSG